LIKSIQVFHDQAEACAARPRCILTARFFLLGGPEITDKFNGDTIR
jgi:hypothetical protein